jgi:hypothetical protein
MGLSRVGPAGNLDCGPLGRADGPCLYCGDFDYRYCEGSARSLMACLCPFCDDRRGLKL